MMLTTGQTVLPTVLRPTMTPAVNTLNNAQTGATRCISMSQTTSLMEVSDDILFLTQTYFQDSMRSEERKMKLRQFFM